MNDLELILLHYDCLELIHLLHKGIINEQELSALIGVDKVRTLKGENNENEREKREHNIKYTDCPVCSNA